MTSDLLICVTPRAAAMVHRYAREAAVDDAMSLRLEVIGGAASGFAYDLFFDVPGPDDTVIEGQGIRVVVGVERLHLLAGSVIDWVEGSNGAGFRIANPNEPEK
jgi:iron-sulfur cluster assembly accessory protein